MPLKKQRTIDALNFWPGFIEILAILILVTMFLTLVYGAAQYFIVQGKLSESAEPSLPKESQTLQIRLDDMRHAFQALQVEYDQARMGLQRQKDASAKAADEADLTAKRLQAELEQIQDENRALKLKCEELANSMRDHYIHSMQRLELDRRTLEDEQYGETHADDAMVKRLALLVRVNEEQADEIAELESGLEVARAVRDKLLSDVARLSAKNTQLEQEVANQREVINELKAQRAHLSGR